MSPTGWNDWQGTIKKANRLKHLVIILKRFNNFGQRSEINATQPNTIMWGLHSGRDPKPKSSDLKMCCHHFFHSHEFMNSMKAKLNHELYINLRKNFFIDTAHGMNSTQLLIYSRDLISPTLHFSLVPVQLTPRGRQANARNSPYFTNYLLIIFNPTSKLFVCVCNFERWKAFFQKRTIWKTISS